MSIKVKNTKSRKEGLGLFTLDGNDVYIGKDWALQSEIDEVKAKTKAKGCFRECRSCGACSASRRDAPSPYTVDPTTGKQHNCVTCEKFRFHDCHNGFMRDSRQEAEEFTEDVQKIIRERGGKPLI